MCSKGELSWCGEKSHPCPASVRVLGPSPGHGCSDWQGQAVGTLWQSKKMFPATAAAAVAEAPSPRGPQSPSHHFCPFFRNHLAAAPPPTMPGLQCSQPHTAQNQLELVTSALKEGGRCLGPPDPLAWQTGWSGGNSSTNSMTGNLKARALTLLRFPNAEGKERVASPITQF